jgi:hypothetical protein
MTTLDPTQFDQFFRNCPAGIDVDALRREYMALHPPYAINARRLPQPVWMRKGYSENGPQAWNILKAELQLIEPGRAFCIYIHISGGWTG